MNKLMKLRAAFVNMTPEQQAEKLREIREDRKISKHSTTARTAKKDKKASGAVSKFKSLSADEQEALIKALQEDIKNED